MISLAWGAWYTVQGYVLLFCAYVLAPGLAYGLRAAAVQQLFRRPPASGAPQTTFLLLVPAHNEEALLPGLLVYHALVEQAVPYLAPVHIERARFAEQMAWLAASGLPVRPLAEALAALRQPSAPGPIVALTFDDGYHSLYTHARPLLAQYGFAASLFLTTGAVGQPSYDGERAAFARSAPRGDRPLTWPELRELQAMGWAIEAHGCTHRPLAGLAPAAQAQELRQSRAAITHHLGHAPAHYAFPYGSYDRRTLRALAEAGYAAGFAVHTGPATPASDWRRLPRLEVTAGCDLATFQRLVRTGHTSPGARYRARLRDWAYRVPAVHDALLAAGRARRG